MIFSDRQTEQLQIASINFIKFKLILFKFSIKFVCLGFVPKTDFTELKMCV